MKQRMRQFTALILALAMCLSLLSANVWAAESEPPEDESLSVLSSEELSQEEGAETEDVSEPEENPTEETSEPEVGPAEEDVSILESDAQSEEGTEEYEGSYEAEESVQEEAQTEEEPSLSPQSVVASGKCGDNLTWTLENTGTLTISGKGKMDNYEYEWLTPWYYDISNDITAIVIKQGVTSIGDWSFNDCNYLNSVIIPNSVTSIGWGAFDSCQDLTNINIPNSVTSIGDGCFNLCYSLASINIPSSVTCIGEDVFSNCTNLTNINIPNSVTSIGRCAFEYCYSLTSINIPNSVTSIGSSAFRGCTSLTSITIPNSVKSIGYYAFCDCSKLTSIYFKGDAPEIETDAFDGVTATAYYPAGNKTWTLSKKKNYGGNITWKEWNPDSGTSDSSLTTYQKKVLQMINRTRQTTTPLQEFHDPNDMILDYLSASDLSKMVVTETGTHLSSHSMWKEAYYRALDKLTGIDQIESVLSDADTLFGNYDFVKETLLSDKSMNIPSTAVSVYLAATKDELRKYMIDVFTLNEISEKATNDDLKSACSDRLEKRQYELKKTVLKQMQSILADYDGVTAPKLEQLSALLAKNTSKKVAVALKSLGYAAEAISYVSTVLTVKDIVVKGNGWSDLTEAYQDSIADTMICQALVYSYEKHLSNYNNSHDPKELDTIGFLFERIILYTQDNYKQMKSILGKKYDSVIQSDSYLKNRINLVNSLSIDTYNKSDVQYLQPKLSVSGSLSMEIGDTVKFSVLNTRYGVSIKHSIKKLIASNVISVKKGYKVTAKNVGRAKVTVKVKQNGTEYQMSFEVNVKPKTPTLSSVSKNKKNNAEVKWKKERGITGYELEYSTNSKFRSGVKTTTLKGSGKTNATIKDLKKGKTYYFRLRSYKTIKKKAYYSKWSKTYKLTGKTVPSPTRLVSTRWDKENKVLIVYWEKKTSYDGYELQIAKDKNFRKGKFTLIIDKSYTATVISDMSKGKYYIRIRTINGKAYSKWSKVKTVKAK